MTAPAISVLMPVYNAERFLEEAVDSVLAQTLRDFELIAIDDGSTDASLRILRESAARDPRIRVVSRPNQGLIATLNEALHVARGELIARMDADDVSLPERFGRQQQHLRAHPDCVAVGSRVLLIDPGGGPLREIGENQDHEGIDRAYLEGGFGTIVHAAAMFRRATLLEIGGYRPRFDSAEDVDLFLRLAERGRLANLPDVLYRYRMHHASIGHVSRKQHLASREAIREARARRGLAPSKEDAVEPSPAVDPVPAPARVREAEHHRRWAWWALQSGYLATARKQALSAFWKSPASLESWRVLFCALRGR